MHYLIYDTEEYANNFADPDGFDVNIFDTPNIIKFACLLEKTKTDYTETEALDILKGYGFAVVPESEIHPDDNTENLKLFRRAIIECLEECYAIDQSLVDTALRYGIDYKDYGNVIEDE